MRTRIKICCIQSRLGTLLPTTKRVQVIHVENERAPELISVYAPHVHAFLLDSGRPDAEKLSAFVTAVRQADAAADGSR